MHTANLEIREYVIAYKRLKTSGKSLLTFRPEKVVAVAYRRWSFTLQLYSFDWEKFGVLDRRSLNER